ncbi:hypothetical protein CHS0354_038575 [Potamilus streckersoni]|uniref:Uncharacterized protein n=1 Tax=Potamilus streckersoni TaxID=2493646 RepID=A0AAE0RS28_9BIVA|nr:hypothetical protein CHS0354_038575 [Potamilus streckersoni]
MKTHNNKLKAVSLNLIVVAFNNTILCQTFHLMRTKNVMRLRRLMKHMAMKVFLENQRQSNLYDDRHDNDARPKSNSEDVSSSMDGTQFHNYREKWMQAYLQL